MSRVIGFYGAGDAYGCFSNFYRAPFKFEGKCFTWSEQYIMYKKAELFEDAEMMRAVMLATTPMAAKSCGRKVSGYVDSVWVERRVELSTAGIYEKFKQNRDIRDILLGTGDAILAECAPRDKIWGIGMGVSNPAVQHPGQWRGQNILGSILMDVRRRLRDDLGK